MNGSFNSRIQVFSELWRAIDRIGYDLRAFSRGALFLDRKKHDLSKDREWRENRGIFTRVVPLDNFMIYKDIIRLDRPDWEQKEPVR